MLGAITFQCVGSLDFNQTPLHIQMYLTTRILSTDLSPLNFRNVTYVSRGVSEHIRNRVVQRNQFAISLVPDCLYYWQGETITDTGFTAGSVTITMSHESHKGRAMEPDRSVMFSIGHSNGMQPVACGNLRAAMLRGRNCQMTNNQLDWCLFTPQGKRLSRQAKLNK